MALITMANKAQLLFESAGYGGNLQVVEFSGHEGLSELFGFKILLSSMDGDIDFNSLVGKPALLTIMHESGQRHIHGRVLSFEYIREGREQTYYQAKLVPLFYFLNYRRDCRIFQNQDVPSIVQKVLQEAGIPGDHWRLALQKGYKVREFCVQYRETDWDFISRLLEEEGIFYFFEHSPQKHTLVLGDGSAAFQTLPGKNTVIFREKSGMAGEEEYIHAWRYLQQIRPGSVCIRDFNFKQPRLDLESSDSKNLDSNLELYDFPGNYDEPGQGQNLARTSLTSQQAKRLLAKGQGVSRRLLPGYKFSLQDHPRQSFNQEYLITHITHRASQAQAAGFEALEANEKGVYSNEFTAIPGSQEFSPSQKTAKPVISGTQTAIVVGPKGEEIYTDSYGRIKIQFHWDREGDMDENSSCWVRVSQGWAGGRYGALHLPRLGQEVVVSFEEGNPDRPLITGRVYNADQRPPYPLPDEKTKTTIKSDTSKGSGGYNELRFEDKKGSEQIFTHAQKDRDIRVKNDQRAWVGNDSHLIVKNDRKELIENDKHNTVQGSSYTQIQTDSHTTITGNDFNGITGNKTQQINGNDTSEVSGNKNRTVMGNVLSSIQGNSSTTVLGNDISQVTGSRSTTVTGEVVETYSLGHKQTAGTEIFLKAGMKVVLEAGLELTIKAAGGFIKIDPMGITINGNLLLINSGGVPGIGTPGMPLPAIPAMPGQAPQAPTQPDEADDGSPGRDMNNPKTSPPVAPFQYMGQAFSPPGWPPTENNAAAGLKTQAEALRRAAKNNKPFCAICNQ